MRSMVTALTWEYFHKAGWTVYCLVAGCFSFMFVYASLAGFSQGGLDKAPELQLQLEVALLPTVMAMILVSAGAGVWPVNKLYTRPISNLSITAWLIGAGTVMILCLLPVIIWSYNYFYHASWPLLGAVLFTIALWAVMQPLFLIGTRSLTSLAVTGTPILAMGVWYMSRYGLHVRNTRHDWEYISIGELITLAIVFGAGCAGTYYSVAWDRCGQWLRWQVIETWMLERLSRWSDTRHRARPAFRSPQSAYFWFHWRHKGLVMTFPVLFIFAVILAVHGINWLRGADTTYQLQPVLASVPMGLAFLFALYGFFMGWDMDRMATVGIRWRREGRGLDADRLGSFHSILPITTPMMARTYLVVCGLGMLCGWATWLTGYALMVASIGQLESWPGFWPASERWQTVLFAIGLSWLLASNLMSAVCTGRTVLWLVGGASLLVGYAAVLSFAYWLAGTTVASRITNVLGLLFVIAVLATVVVCYVQAIRRHLIGVPSTLVAAGLCGLLIALSRSLAMDVNLQSWLAVSAASGLCVLPWAAMPLALEHNRHT